MFDSGREETVICVVVSGDQAHLVVDGGDVDDAEPWPAEVIARETGLGVRELPGRRFRVRVSQELGRVSFSGFTVAS